MEWLDPLGAAQLFAPTEASEHPVTGLEGPTWKGQLLKQSAHVGQWADRYFVLQGRKLWYYDREAEARPRADMPMGAAKGYYDCVGAKVSVFEEQDPSEGDAVFFGFELEEEFSVWAGDIETEPERIRLCHSDIAARDDLVDKLRYAARPRWIPDDDPRAELCMESREPFSLLPDPLRSILEDPLSLSRKHHCRRCGGVFLKKVMVAQPLPALGYEEPVWCCRPCAEGTKKASRWITKLPMAARATKEKGVGDQVANEIKDVGAMVFHSVSSLFSADKSG